MGHGGKMGGTSAFTNLQLAWVSDRQISQLAVIGPRGGIAACRVSIVHHRCGLGEGISTIAM